MKGTGSSCTTQRQQQHANRVGLLVVLLILFSLLYSTVGTISPVDAAQRDTDCPSGQEYNERTQQCEDIVDVEASLLQDDATDDQADAEDVQDDVVDDVTDDATDDVQDDVVDDVTDDTTDDVQDDAVDDVTDDTQDDSLYDPDGTGYLEIYKFNCDPGFTADNANLDDYTSNCTEAASGIPFELYDSQGLIDSGSTNGSGFTDFSDLPAGFISIAELIPEGYGTPVVFCSWGPDESSAGQYNQFQLTDGFYITVEYDPDWWYSCYWFDFPAADYGITIYKYICDSPDYVPEPGQWSLEDYQFYCEGSYDDYDDFGFELIDSSGVPTSQVVGDRIPDGVYFDEYEYGPVTLTELSAEGFGTPVVYCGLVPPGTDAPLEPDAMEVSSEWSVSFDAEENAQYVCHWFNIPSGHDITIYKYYCDQDYVVGEYDYQWYFDNCTEWHDGATFWVDDDPKSIEGSDNVWWDDVPSGDLTIREEHEEGYGTPVVYCWLVGDDPGLAEPQQMQLSDTGEWTYPYQEDYRLICYVYNIPYTFGIDIYKWECPPTYAYSEEASYEDLSENCTTAKDEVEFSLGNGTDTYDSGFTGDDGPGWLHFDSYEPGEVVITETPLEGYGKPIVWCTFQYTLETTSSISLEQQEVADDWSISTSLDEGYQIVCHWFNFPAYDGITIYKYYCEPDYVVDEYDYEWYRDNCTDWHDGATFWIGDESKAISGSDLVTFDNIPYGDVTIREEHEQGYGTPVVYCWLEGADAAFAAPEEYEVSETGEWTAPYTEGYSLICYVFNVPTYDPDIVIHKYYCPDDFVPQEGSTLQYYQGECTTPHEDVPFEVYDDTDASVATGSTDAEGYVEFSGLPAGTYRVEETPPEGYGTLAVYCSNQGDPLQYDVYDGNNIDVELGEPTDPGYLECWWFNYPDGHDIWIYKYFCDVAYAPEEISYTYYEECLDPMSGVHFDAYGFDSPLGSGDTDDFGYVQFSGLPAGDYRIQEIVPEGYERPVVYCWLVGPDGDTAAYQDAEPEYYEVSESGEINATIDEGYTLICHWYNFRADHDITIYKYYCEAAYDPATTEYEWYRDNCLTTRGGDTFHVNGDAKTIGQDAQNNLENSVWWDDVPYGSVTIGETIPEGYGRPIVYCWLIAPDQDPATYQDTAPTAYEVSETGEIVLDYPENYRIVCVWFNFPEEYDVWIYKFYCEPGYQPETVHYQSYFDTCTTTHDGAVFHVGDQTKTVGPDSPEGEPNKLVYNDVPTGQVAIGEELPEGYGVPYVWCWLIGPDQDLANYQQTAPQQYEVSETGEIVVDYPEGYRLICFWFNFPDDHDVVIYKYYCEEAWQEHYDYFWYRDNCTTTRGGDTFHVNGDAKTIGEDAGNELGNSLVWEDVPAGTVTIGETVPEGYGRPVVYCWLVGPNDDLEDYQDTAPRAYEVSETGEISVDYPEGYYLICIWYNFPEDHDIVIYKYICPYGYDYENATEEELHWYCEVVAIPIPFAIGDDSGTLESQETGAVIPGGVAFDGYADGPYTISEEIPEGYGEPRVFCRVVTTTTEPILFASAEFTEYDVTEGAIELGGEAAAAADFDYSWWCNWFNFEGQADDNTLTIYKYECPAFGEDVVVQDTYNWLSDNCTQVMEDVTFTLDDLAGPRSKDTDNTGKVVFDDMNNGPVVITEEIPSGYGQPSVFCGWTAFWNGAVYDAFTQKVDAPDGVYTTSYDIPNTDAWCYWFNFPDYPGDITIYKYWCPVGYDLYAWGSDPYDDCKTVGSDITFDLDGDEKQTDDEGIVFWGDLDPGTYTVTEHYPADTQYSFVLNCWGGRFAGIQPYPLQFEPDLEVKLVAGDHIYCYWYNVPKYEDGWITVYKYWCSTKTYKSEVDCQIYENGMEFDLNTYPGDDLVASGTTDGYGKWTWYNVPEGNYKIEEKGYSWCAIDISKEGPDESIQVDNNEETVVKVYNCDPPEDTPDDTPGETPTKKPNPKNPTKYPNTGADPNALTLPSTGAGPFQGGDMTAIIILAVLAALTLAAGGFVLRRRNQPEDTADPAVSSDPPNFTRRTVVGTALAAVTVPFAAVAAQDGDDNDREPEEDELATPWATPDVPQCREDATPDASDPDEDPDCIRGEVPKHIAIAVIGVDADIEIQEIIAGELQDPTGPTLVTWYKETSRLGERGNGVYAGHLNYWGVPEGVFFAIKTLVPGDEIVLTGENDEEFVYAVQWVENQPGQDDPEPEVLGLTEDEAITLITCGGEWDTTIAEYNERTTVRAIRQKPEPEDA